MELTFQAGTLLLLIAAVVAMLTRRLRLPYSVAEAVRALLRIRLRRVIPDMRISRLSGWHDGGWRARLAGEWAKKTGKWSAPAGRFPAGAGDREAFGKRTCKPNSVVCGHSSRRRVAADTHQRPTRRFRQLLRGTPATKTCASQQAKIACREPCLSPGTPPEPPGRTGQMRSAA